MNERIKQLLAIPSETRQIEFKRLGEQGSSNISKILKSIVAMTNTDGGILILGIDDPEKGNIIADERIYGIEESLEKYDEIGREIEKIRPPIPGLWSNQNIISYNDNKRIAVLNIPKSREAFHSWNDKVYIRLEKGNKSLPPSELIKFSYLKGFTKADTLLVDIDFELLKTEYYENWRNERQISNNTIEEVLFHTGLARKHEDGLLLPTVAAVLLFAQYPNDILEYKTSIKVTQYTDSLERISETPNIISVPKIINGPLIQLIKNTHDYVLTLLRSGIRIPSGFTTIYQIPERAVKEAITNAVIHRDYFTKRDIEIRIFEDRVEIESPGLLPSNITSFNIGYERAESYRNDLLVKHLRSFPSPPNLDQNEGVRAMRNEMDSANLYQPLFWTYPHKDDSVIVILFNEHRSSEWEKVLSYLNNQGKYITNTIVRDITGITDRSTVSRLLTKWVAKGLLNRIDPESGSRKNIKYIL